MEPIDGSELSKALDKVKETQENAVNQIVEMGFGRDQAIDALKVSVRWVCCRRLLVTNLDL